MPQQDVTEPLQSSEDIASVCASISRPRMKPKSIGSDASSGRGNASRSSSESSDAEQKSSNDESDIESDSENDKPGNNADVAKLDKKFKKFNLRNSNSKCSEKCSDTEQWTSDDETDVESDSDNDEPSNNAEIAKLEKMCEMFGLDNSNSKSSDSKQKSSDDDETDIESDSENDEPSDNTEIAGLKKRLEKRALRKSNSSKASEKRDSASDNATGSETERDSNDSQEFVSRGPDSSSRARKKCPAPYDRTDRGRNVENDQLTLINELDDDYVVGRLYESHPDLVNWLDNKLGETYNNGGFGNDSCSTSGNCPTNMPALPDIWIDQPSPVNSSPTHSQTSLYEGNSLSPSYSPGGNSMYSNPGFWAPDSPANIVSTGPDKLLNGNIVTSELKNNPGWNQIDPSSPGSTTSQWGVVEAISQNSSLYNTYPSPGSHPLSNNYANTTNISGTYPQGPNIPFSPDLPVTFETGNDVTVPIHETFEQTSMNGTCGGNTICNSGFENNILPNNLPIANTTTTTASMPPINASFNNPTSQPSPMVQHFATPTRPVRSGPTSAARKQLDCVTMLKTPTISGCDSLMEDVSEDAAHEAALKMMTWEESRSGTMKDSSLMALIRNLKPRSKAKIVALVRKMMTTTPETFSYKNASGEDALYLAAILHPELPELSRFIAEAWAQTIANLTTNVQIQPTPYNILSKDTLLHLVVRQGDSHAKVLQELLSVKSGMFDVTAVNGEGKTPFDVASQIVNKSTVEICRLLREHYPHYDTNIISLDNTDDYLNQFIDEFPLVV